MSRIHPTAMVDSGAALADGVEIGPWSVVGPGVELGEDVRLLSHVVIQQDTVVGARTTIHPFCVIGGDPQHGGYKGEPVRLEIGEDCLVREHSTFNRGTPVGGGLTRIGKGCMFMTGAHVGHDAIVGDHVTFANQATLGGHSEVGDRVFLGGLSAVHQFGRVGQGAIIGGLPVRFVTALWDGNGAPEGAVGTHLKGRVDGRYVYGVCSGQQTEDGADEVSCYELWPLRLDARQMMLR